MSHLVELPVFEFEGKTFTFKRLGAKTALTLVDQVTEAANNGLIDLDMHLQKLATLTGQELDALRNADISPDIMMFFTVRHCLESFIDLMADHLLELKDKEKVPVTFEDLMDEEKFPMFAYVLMAVFFLRHPDLYLFVSAFNSAKELPLVQDLLAQMKTNVQKQLKSKKTNSNLTSITLTTPST